MAILARYKISVDSTSGSQINTQTYYFLSSPTTYLNIESVTGVRKVTNPSEFNAPLIRISELLRAGVLLKFVVSGKTTTNQRRSFRILVLRSRAEVFSDNLVNRMIQGVKITSVIAQRQAFYF